MRSAGIEVDDRLIEAIDGHAGHIVGAEANDRTPKLIVCGTHGRRGPKRLLMGSDAEYIVRHSPVPGPPRSRIVTAGLAPLGKHRYMGRGSKEQLAA